MRWRWCQRVLLTFLLCCLLTCTVEAVWLGLISCTSQLQQPVLESSTLPCVAACIPSAFVPCCARSATPPAGSVFRSRMEGSELGVLESWRFMRGNSMAVRTALRPARGGPEVRGVKRVLRVVYRMWRVQEAGRQWGCSPWGGCGWAWCSRTGTQLMVSCMSSPRLLTRFPVPPLHVQAVMFWFFDRMETLQRHVARGGMGRRSLRQQIEAGALCAAQACGCVCSWHEVQ